MILVLLKIPNKKSIKGKFSVELIDSRLIEYAQIFDKVYLFIIIKINKGHKLGNIT